MNLIIQRHVFVARLQKKSFKRCFYCVRHDLVLDDLAFNYLHAFGQQKK